LEKETSFIGVIPVLPSSDIARDVAWYLAKAGFESVWDDKMYAVLHREGLSIHLQWHADTSDDPLIGGSVVRIMVKNIRPLFDDFVQRGVVKADELILGTAWETNEFGFYDLNNNAILFTEDLMQKE
jgi:hypothetical protein